jgi:hypothetical protein
MDEDDAEFSGTNCTDETKREWYRKALIAKIALESSQATAKKKNGEYRAVLKDAKKAGVDTASITFALSARFEDPDLLLIEERERLKMLDLSGILPGIKDKLLGRLDIEEPTANEAQQISLDRAYDCGVFDGREGHMREQNPHDAGTELYDAHDRGWLDGQRAIADQMSPEPPKAEAAPRQPRSRRNPVTVSGTGTQPLSEPPTMVQ